MRVRPAYQPSLGGAHKMRRAGPVRKMVHIPAQPPQIEAYDIRYLVTLYEEVLAGKETSRAC